jgi:DNA-binding transcriptional ArsR family regulator
MPSRVIVAKELAELFKVLAHPDRIRIIEELHKTECNVTTLSERLDLTGSRVSQHLSLMRAHRFVEERRDGRQHVYHLTQPDMADWIVQGLDFIEGRLKGPSPKDLQKARSLWAHEKPNL